MRNINKLILTGLLVAAPAFFTGCSNDGNDEVGRDRNVPNNIEDNYTGDADHNRTGENEEEVKSKVNNMRSDVNNNMAGYGTGTDYNSSTMNNKSSLEARVDKLEKELMDMKSAKKGADIVGQK